MTLPEQAAGGMLDACETLEPAQIARLAHPHDEQAFDRTRQLLLGAIEAGDLLALGVVCDLKAQARIKERPVNYAVTTLSEWSMRDEQRRQSAEMVLQRMRTLASMGGAPTLPPAHGEGWLPSDPWPSERDPHDVFRRVCACDPRRIAPERVLLIDHQLSQRDIPRDSLRNFIAEAPSLVQRQLFPQNSPLWQWLGQKPAQDDTPPVVAGDKVERRIEIIVEELRALGVADLMAVPIEKKGKVRARLCSRIPKLFTNSTFDDAWKKGSSKSAPAFRIVNRDMYNKGAQ